MLTSLNSIFKNPSAELEDDQIVVRLFVEEKIGTERLRQILIQHGWNEGLRQVANALAAPVERAMEKLVQDVIHREVVRGNLSFTEKTSEEGE